jgi:hypothetical protein
MCEVALFGLFVDIAIDQVLKSNDLTHRQAMVDFESETFGPRLASAFVGSSSTVPSYVSERVCLCYCWQLSLTMVKSVTVI